MKLGSILSLSCGASKSENWPVPAVVFFGITLLARTYFGHGGYGLIVVLAVFMLWFLYTMAKSDVESKEREELYNKEIANFGRK